MKSSKKSSIIETNIKKFISGIQDVETGEYIDTVYNPIKISKSKMKELKKQGWLFDWNKVEKDNPDAVTYEVRLQNSDEIQGLISIEDKGSFIWVPLVESAPHNICENRKYRSVGGHLFSIASKQSFDAGYEGFVAFDVKTRVVSYYQNVLGAKRLNFFRMYIDRQASLELIVEYIEKGYV